MKNISIWIILFFAYNNVTLASDFTHSIISVGNGYSNYSTPRIGYSLGFRHIQIDFLAMVRQVKSSRFIDGDMTEYKSKDYDTYIFCGYSKLLTNGIEMIPSIGINYSIFSSEYKRLSNTQTFDETSYQTILNISFLKEYNHFLVGVGSDVFTYWEWLSSSSDGAYYGNFFQFDPQLILGYRL